MKVFRSLDEEYETKLLQEKWKKQIETGINWAVWMTVAAVILTFLSR